MPIVRRVRMVALLLTASCGVGCGQMNSEDRKEAIRKPDSLSDTAVVYGQDNRVETFESRDAEVLDRAASSVALVRAQSLKIRKGFSPLDPDFAKSLVVSGKAFGAAQHLCEDERFFTQQTGAFCSGVLVGPDLILTAGHCVRSAFDCQDTRFVFDYSVERGGQESVEVNSANIYSCSEIIRSVVTKDSLDYALVRLDRPVAGGRRPVTLRREGIAQIGDSLYAIGHPSGLPQKISIDGKVREIENDHLVASLDTYEGSSGSPVFNSKSGVLEGILVRGESDFARHGSCYKTRRCLEGSCRGEDVMRIDRITSEIDKASR